MSRQTDRLIAMQFFVVVMPIACVLVGQMAFDGRRAAKLEDVESVRVQTTEIRSNYKTFLNGVANAADSGSLEIQSRDALNRSAAVLQNLNTSRDQAVLNNTEDLFKGLIAAIPEHAPLAKLTPLRETIRRGDELTSTIESQANQAVENAVRTSILSEQRQKFLTVMAIALSCALTYLFVRFARRRLRRRTDADTRVATEGLRLKQALDSVSSNVMLADHDNKIIYLNPRAQHLFDRVSADLCRDIPDLDPKNLVGTSIDRFHRQLQYPKGLARLSDSHSATTTVGSRTLNIIANPVMDAAGQRHGTVVEWSDLTEARATEEEVKSIVQTALDGDLLRRISTADKNGFFLVLSEGVNRLLDINAQVISDSTRMFDALAQGDVTQRIENSYKGAFAKLKTDANATMERLIEIVGAITEHGRAVSTGAREVASGVSDLNSRTKTQAASLEETAASMEEMAATVKQNSESAQQANALAATACAQAAKGGEVVQAAIQAMSEIHTSSRKISDIIRVIDEIAFQTNLLALNAAVEAARAGEQGRGFAVVASEVRNLAGRSAVAAKEIKDLILASGGKVDEGRNLVAHSGIALNEIMLSVKKVSDINTKIAEASRDQAAGIDVVNKTVIEMDTATQQNAALVEESADATQRMSEQARDLLNQVAFFRLSATSALSSGSEQYLGETRGGQRLRIRSV